MKKLLSILSILSALLTLLTSCATPCACPCCCETEAEANTEKKPVYDLTEGEIYVLSRLVFFEASVCSDECQRAIASVVINQWRAGYWGDDIMGICINPAMYATANQNIHDTREATEREVKNVRYVVENGVTIPSDVYYFRNNHHFGWDGYEGLFEIDNVYFGHFTNGNH